METKAIVTIPPYAPYIAEVLRHPVVSGVRLNTVMPVAETLEEVLKRINGECVKHSKDLWVDLKCRQLRVATYCVPPFTEIELTHNIHVDTPVKAYFKDGEDIATVLKVNGNKLIMQEGPRKIIGPGESVNIPDASLTIEGYFTQKDIQYIEAGKKAGVSHYMLSFVEGKSDIEEFRKLYPEAMIAAKIESKKGLRYVKNEFGGEAQLMAARGDLFVELDLPHHIIEAEEEIVKKDPNAIVASRLFDSLTQGLEPSCADIGDVDSLIRMGYKTFMFGDYVCMRRDSIMSALNLLYAMGEGK